MFLLTEERDDESPIESNELHEDHVPLLSNPRVPSFSLVLIVCPLVLATLASSMTNAPFVQTIIMIICKHIDSENTADLDYQTCSASLTVQKVSSLYLTILTLSTNIPSLLSTPIITHLSDTRTKKIGMTLPVLGKLIHFLAIVIVLKFDLWLGCLVFINLLHAWCGTYHVQESSAFAYVVNLMDEADGEMTANHRTSIFGRLESFIYGSFMLGPFLGGVLMTQKIIQDEAFIFYFSAALLSGSIIINIFCLPAERNRISSDSSSKEWSLFTTIHQSFRTQMNFISNSCLKIKLLLLIAALGSIVLSGFQFMFLYTSLRFGWDSYEIGKYMLCLAVSRVVLMSFVLPCLLRRGEAGLDSVVAESLISKTPDFKISLLRASLIFTSVGILANALVQTEFQFYVVGILESFGIISVPLLNGILSSSVSQDKQGVLFSTISIIRQISGLISPVMFGWIYQKSIEWPNNPGVLYFGSLSLLYTSCFFISLFVNKILVQDHLDEEVTINSD